MVEADVNTARFNYVSLEGLAGLFASASHSDIGNINLSLWFWCAFFCSPCRQTRKWKAALEERGAWAIWGHTRPLQSWFRVYRQCEGQRGRRGRGLPPPIYNLVVRSVLKPRLALQPTKPIPTDVCFRTDVRSTQLFCPSWKNLCTDCSFEDQHREVAILVWPGWGIQSGTPSTISRPTLSQQQLFVVHGLLEWVVWSQ